MSDCGSMGGTGSVRLWKHGWHCECVTVEARVALCVNVESRVAL